MGPILGRSSSESIIGRSSYESEPAPSPVGFEDDGSTAELRGDATSWARARPRWRRSSAGSVVPSTVFWGLSKHSAVGGRGRSPWRSTAATGVAFAIVSVDTSTSSSSSRSNLLLDSPAPSNEARAAPCRAVARASPLAHDGATDRRSSTSSAPTTARVKARPEELEAPPPPPSAARSAAANWAPY